MGSRRAIFWVTAMVGFATLTSCAYFNTLYNARKKYNDAQKAERQAARPMEAQQITDDMGNTVTIRRGPQVPTGTNMNAQIYEDVIEKCRHVIARYPDSRHVDDAMLLIGKSLFALERYDESVSALDTLVTRYPKTNLREEAEFLKAKSLVKAEHYDAAVAALNHFVDNYRKSGDRPEAFYLLCTSLMQLGLSDNAVAALQRLEKDHGRSEYRYRAQTDMAAILVEKGLYTESLAVYDRLSQSRIPKSMRYDVWMGMSRSQIELGQFDEAVATLAQLHKGNLSPEREPQVYLLRARAYAGADSIDRAINLYTTVNLRASRTAYSAEANYRLGILYESMDSLQTAQRFYQEVPRAYSGSDFAEEAIRRAGDIGRVLRLQQTEGDDSPEANALRTFAMAELQLLQFKSTDKAIPSYQKIVSDYPDSEFAPKSAYALGYIYGVIKEDSVKAREWYEVLRTRYGDSQQAQLAYAFYKGAAPPPTIEEMMRYGARKAAPVIPAPSAAPDTARVTAPVDTMRHVVAPPDSAPPARALPDSLRDPEERLQRPDTSAVEPDTTDGN